jgi:hypothetical protein
MIRINENTVIRTLFLPGLTVLCFATGAGAGFDSTASSPQACKDITASGQSGVNADTNKALIIALKNPVSQPNRTSSLEKDLFLSTWWCYHAAFAADFTTTGMVLDRGGREADPLYTLFGEKNTAGVIGSGVAVHAVASIISLQLFKAARTRHGAWRFLLHAAATGINSYFICIHTVAIINNIKVYNKLGNR